jgi:hypothetical protein
MLMDAWNQLTEQWRNERWTFNRVSCKRQSVNLFFLRAMKKSA